VNGWKSVIHTFGVEGYSPPTSVLPDCYRMRNVWVRFNQDGGGDLWVWGMRWTAAREGDLLTPANLPAWIFVKLAPLRTWLASVRYDYVPWSEFVVS